MKTHILKPRLDASGAPPSVKAQQQAKLKEKEAKKKKPEGKQELVEREGEGEGREDEGREDGGPGSGPQPGGGSNRRKKERRKQRVPTTTKTVLPATSLSGELKSINPREAKAASGFGSRSGDKPGKKFPVTEISIGRRK